MKMIAVTEEHDFTFPTLSHAGLVSAGDSSQAGPQFRLTQLALSIASLAPWEAAEVAECAISDGGQNSATV